MPTAYAYKVKYYSNDDKFDAAQLQIVYLRSFFFSSFILFIFFSLRCVAIISQYVPIFVDLSFSLFHHLLHREVKISCVCGGVLCLLCTHSDPSI